MSASLLVSSGNGPGECRQAVAHVLDRLRADAARANLEIDIRETPGRDGPASAVVVLTGEGAGALAAAWTGPILWRCQSALRPGHRRKNWFVELFPLPRSGQAVRIRPEEVAMQAIRAGGPGGQHQNKTSSAIRARWQAPDGRVYHCVVRDSRSQHRNRSLALARLEILAAQDAEARRLTERSEARRRHHGLQRGRPVRVFEGPSFRETRN